MRIHSMAWLDVNAAWALGIAGALLIYWELCRPGSVVPGALGGVCLLTAIAYFASASIPWETGPLLGGALLLLAAETWWRWPGPPGLAGAALLTAAAMAAAVRWFVAAPLALAFSFATVVLGSAAIRAYVAKRI